MPIILRLSRLQAADTFAVAPYDASRTVFTTPKWKPPSSCDMGVIALNYRKSSAGTGLPRVSKGAVKPLAVVARTRLLEVPSDDLGAEHEISQPS